mmetsp:Transcript_14100/g.30620  ORF Transcript_14100/g.30620 Transcript_14100/m.30620 type:complete len:278 (-) Transcript_14100:850-1683(-)|eukprot:CAMPEP_0183352912 /NCGR_PEP_ID=MMETSP0164_2-20130417/31526_1 /TAXON_ID=221442 /ORGANISM="Coccolithus pelagicus ssp braarudi, Strain PLY182g" /LENGTH=277 /DNA_ID=CAMNT_0025525483 /DNA_START=73 /DNA_END=906 /DNA_ORIENTATION=-
MPPCIDLCGDSPPGGSTPVEAERADGRGKRRRTERPRDSAVNVVQLSDDDDDSEATHARLRAMERARQREATLHDEQLARRLQDEERLSSQLARDLGLPMPPLSQLARDLGLPMPPFMPSQLARAPFAMGYPMQHHNAFGALPRHPNAPGGQLAHLSLLNRDFTESDYEMLLQLDEVSGPQKKQKLRANAQLLDQLPTRRLPRAEALAEQSCCVCLEAMRAQQAVLSLPCKHEFHKGCILKWLKANQAPSCPICKAPVLEESASASTAATADEWWHT